MDVVRCFFCLAVAVATWIASSTAAAAAISRKSRDLESPAYKVVHSESDFEIRKYNRTSWMTAHVDAKSFTIGTYKGFHKLFQYIEGANLNSSRVPMTAPILTSIVQSSGHPHSSVYVVRLYIPRAFKKSPPVPLPELKLKVETLGERCIAIRKFSGFARDANVAKEITQLFSSLKDSAWKHSFFEKPALGDEVDSVAQYRTPFQIFSRINEVWVTLAKLKLDDCSPKSIMQKLNSHESM